MGVRKTTPLPGLSGARRETRNSKFAPALLMAVKVSANPPGRSAISPAHTSTFLMVYAMARPPLNVSNDGFTSFDPKASGNLCGSYHYAKETVKQTVACCKKIKGVVRMPLGT
jgi:hypothetical protein